MPMSRGGNRDLPTTSREIDQILLSLGIDDSMTVMRESPIGVCKGEGVESLEEVVQDVKVREYQGRC